MRENFSRGVYPTLRERQQFAAICCDYVQEQQQQQQSRNMMEETKKKTTDHQTDSPRRPLDTDDDAAHDHVLLVSFSFVNTDLRDAFRQRFPAAHWILLDTPEPEAQRRMDVREGHFYKGNSNKTKQQQTKQHTNNSANVPEAGEEEEENDDDAPSLLSPNKKNKPSIAISHDDDNADNSDWEFAPVDFPHLALNGNRPVDENAAAIVKHVQEMVTIVYNTTATSAAAAAAFLATPCDTCGIHGVHQSCW